MSLTDLIYRRETVSDRAPYYRTPPWSVFVANRRSMTFLTGNDDGGTVATLSPQVGTACVVNVQTYFRNFAGRGHGYLQGTGPGAASYIDLDWVGVTTGNNLPFTIYVVAQTNAAGAPVANARLLSIGGTTALVEMLYAGIGTTPIGFIRRNDANLGASPPSVDPGLAPFVLYFAHDGTNLFTSMNGGAITQTPSTGGVTTMTAARWGALSTNHTLNSNPNLQFLYFNNAFEGGARANSMIRFLCRRIGV